MVKVCKLLILVGTWVCVSAFSFFNNKPVPDSAIESEEGYAGVSGVTLVVGKPAPAFSLTAMDGNSVS